MRPRAIRLSRGNGLHCLIAAGILLALALGATGQRDHDATAWSRKPDPKDFKVVGMTTPSRVARLAAVLPARILRIDAAEGSIVRRGDLVIALDDGVQRARTELAKASAESTSDVELARVRWEHAGREWDRLTRLHGDDYASSKELNDAYLGAEATRLEYELAQLKAEQAARVYERERKQWEEFFIRAPFAGYVFEHLKEVGESVDQLEGIVSIAQLDPVYAVVDCPVSLAPFIKVQNKALVRPVDSRWEARVGTVVFASRVADGASQTFKVKLTVPNGNSGWLSGLKVVVDFAADDVTAAGGPALEQWHMGEDQPAPVAKSP